MKFPRELPWISNITLWIQNSVVDGTIDPCYRGQNSVIGTIHGRPRPPIFGGPSTEHLSEYSGVLLKVSIASGGGWSNVWVVEYCFILVNLPWYTQYFLFLDQSHTTLIQTSSAANHFFLSPGSILLSPMHLIWRGTKNDQVGGLDEGIVTVISSHFMWNYVNPSAKKSARA